MSKTYVWDLDGTLCEERRTFEKCLATPKQNNIDIINKLYNNYNQIIIYTARGWQEYKMTEDWLKRHNVKYHLLICGKVQYDFWIDDKAINVEDIDKIMELK